MIKLPKLSKYDETPWEISIADRMRMIGEAAKQGKRVAVMIYHWADTSTFRYRCYNVMQSLEESGKWCSIYFFRDELGFVEKILPQIELLVLTRIPWTMGLENLVDKAKRINIPVVFNVDDRVFNIDDLKLIANTINADIEEEEKCDYWFAYLGRLQKTASMATGFITTNNYLGEVLKKQFGYEYKIIENYLNQEQLTISSQLLEQKMMLKEKDTFVIGYFSGSPSHRYDFEECSNEIFRFLKTYKNTKLQIVGFMEDFSEEAQLLLKQKRIEILPLTNFIELQRLVAMVDVNIVPLVNNVFTNCKSELKYFEAAPVGTITAATPTYAYKNCIRNGETGFLCRPGQWFDTLEKIYHLEQAEREKICDCARMDVLQRYSGLNCVKQIENAYDFFATKK